MLFILQPSPDHILCRYTELSRGAVYSAAETIEPRPLGNCMFPAGETFDHFRFGCAELISGRLDDHRQAVIPAESVCPSYLFAASKVTFPLYASGAYLASRYPFCAESLLQLTVYIRKSRAEGSTHSTTVSDSGCARSMVCSIVYANSAANHAVFVCAAPSLSHR